MSADHPGAAMRADSRFTPGTFTPAPGRGRLVRMLAAQTATETKLALRNGEQVLLTLIIPLALLIGLTELPIIDVGHPRVDWVTPRVLALAIMSTGFTSQAISLGFDRRYGVLKRLAATALPRWLLVAGRVLSGLLVIVVQLVVLGGVAALLGWSPQLVGVGPAIGLLVLGALSFGALGVLLGGSLRAEVVLAVANAVWFILLLAGGIAVPMSSLPVGLADVVDLLPSGALAGGLTDTLARGSDSDAVPYLVLVAWTVVPAAIASRTTRLT
ncbi:transport permease protein [Actinocatenispora thailandica]|uniref:Transport permease protein n=1 Tax=Actinocatenispora thailandica TaxID=227318 RepID=A0A7R7HZK1_9ACTN|nr:ABC transporter permease [Actinocatenispora thailandica]BCJ37429.1 transport permease protein [Actinocatenispora thailandica]